MDFLAQRAKKALASKGFLAWNHQKVLNLALLVIRPCRPNHQKVQTYRPLGWPFLALRARVFKHTGVSRYRGPGTRDPGTRCPGYLLTIHRACTGRPARTGQACPYRPGLTLGPGLQKPLPGKSKVALWATLLAKVCKDQPGQARSWPGRASSLPEIHKDRAGPGPTLAGRLA